MNRTARYSAIAAVALGLSACDSPSSSLTLDGVSSQDADNQYTVGEVIKLNAALQNSGDDTARFGEVHVYRSVDDSLSAADTHLGRYAVADVSAGGSRSELVPVATGGWTPGRYFIGVCNARLESGDATECATHEVNVRASLNLSGLVPGALVVDRRTVAADASGAKPVSLGQTLSFNDAATATYSVAVYRSESLDRDDTATQIGFFNVDAGDTVWRATFDAATWDTGTDYYFSACWANGGLANNLVDCYQMAFPVRVQ
ncbi:MAG: hypothetical protein AAGA11_17640 [Pseudomonadota bacterium]